MVAWCDSWPAAAASATVSARSAHACRTAAISSTVRAWGSLAPQHCGSLPRCTALQVLDLVDSEQWHDAWSKRTALLDLIKERSGIGTMLDMRRWGVVRWHPGGTGGGGSVGGKP